MEQQLRRLIKEVLTCQNGSPEQKQAMDKLLRLIPQLPVYRHPDENIYRRAFNEALVGISLDREGVSGVPLCKFIQKRNLDINDTNQEIVRHFVRWFNKILKFKIIDVYRSLNSKVWSIDKPLSGENKGTCLDTLVSETSNDIDEVIQKEQDKENQRIGRSVWQYIEEDPKGELRSCHPRNHPNANCQELARRLYLKEPPDKLSSIARELNVNYQALNSHLKRSCLAFFREIANNFGYQQEQ